MLNLTTTLGAPSGNPVALPETPPTEAGGVSFHRKTTTEIISTTTLAEPAQDSQKGHGKEYLPPEMRTKSGITLEAQAHKAASEVSAAVAATFPPLATSPKLAALILEVSQGVGKGSGVNLDTVNTLIVILIQNRGESAKLLDQEQQAIKLNTEAATRATQERVKKILEQSDQAIENQKKAQKAGIANVILGFFASAFQVVSGVLKLMAGNPTGALDIAAGVAGLVKVGADIALLVDPNNKTAQEISHWAGVVQMAIGFLSMGLDIVNTIRSGYTAIAAAKAIPRAVKGALSSQSTTISAEVAQDVSKNIMDTVLQKVKDIFSNTFFKGNVSKLLGKLNNDDTLEAIKQAVQSGIKKGMDTAVKKGLTAGSNKAFIKMVSEVAAKEVRKLVFATIRESLGMNKWAQLAMAVASGTNQITSAAYNVELAKGKHRVIEAQLKIQLYTQFITSRKGASDAAGEAANEIIKRLQTQTRDTLAIQHAFLMVTMKA